MTLMCPPRVAVALLVIAASSALSLAQSPHPSTMVTIPVAERKVEARLTTFGFELNNPTQVARWVSVEVSIEEWSRRLQRPVTVGTRTVRCEVPAGQRVRRDIGRSGGQTIGGVWITSEQVWVGSATEIGRMSLKELVNHIQTLPLRGLKPALEKVDALTLETALEQIDGPTLRHAIEEIDRPTLEAALRRIDDATVRESLKRCNEPTCREILDVLRHLERVVPGA